MSKAFLFTGNVCNADNIYSDSLVSPVHPVEFAALPNTSYQAEIAPSGLVATIGVRNFGPVEVGCIGFVRHNLKPWNLVFVDYQLTQGGPWVSAERPNPATFNKQSALFLFPVGSYYAVRIRVTNISDTLRIGYLFLGSQTMLPRDLYVGYTPMPFARQTVVAGGRGQRGDYIGEAVERVDYANSIPLRNIRPDVFRSIFLPLIERREPFFFAQNFIDYPNEYAYCWLSSDPDVSNQLANGFMEITLNVEAIY